MRKTLQRGLCILLCVVMAFSCMTISVGAVVIAPAIAAAVKFIGTSVAGWLVGKVADEALQTLANWFDGKTTDTDGLIATVGALRTAQKTQVSEDFLRELAYEWNSTCYEAVGFSVDVVDYTLDTGEVYRIIAVRPGAAVTAGKTEYCLADGIGRILYCDATTALSGRWSKEADTTGRQFLDYNTLRNLAAEVGGMIRLKDGFYEIYRNAPAKELYCNVAGRRFSTDYESDKSAMNQDRPMAEGSVTNNNTTNNYISNTQIDEGDTFYTYNTENNTYNTTNETYETIINNIEEGDTYYIKEGDRYLQVVIDNSTSIDIENMTQVLPGGVLNNIDSIIYDDNTKTYYVDSHDVTNKTTNFSVYQYHINYTSVTYIGYTEQYDKHYELYYQLPDGRSSADLTVADLEQLSTSFKDVVNYARSADDLSQRALYHFDGNTEDSSYWSYCSSFDWTKGASLTYMDEGTFGGSLYLDETEHDFTLTLPANDAAGDFTLQFRYYQSYTATPKNDSYITIGGVTVLKMDGAKYYNGSGTAITATSVGSWNEICLMRKDGTLHYYINGVPYGSMAASFGTSAVRFYFGATQQTYKKLDELRFTRGAIYEPGKGYMPTSVPYDSNLTLVLPDGKVPLADEVMVFNPGTNNLFNGAGLADWTSSTAKSKVASVPDKVTNVSTVFKANKLYRNTNYTYLVSKSTGTELSTVGTATTKRVERYITEDDYDIQNGLFLPTNYLSFTSYADHLEGQTRLYSIGKDYTLSVVLSDGTYSRITFSLQTKSGAEYGYGGSTSKPVISVSDISSPIKMSVGFLAYGTPTDDDSDVAHVVTYGIFILPESGVTAEIIYMELVEGTASGWSISYEGALYDPGELEESPVLAVRSNTPISTYQIGGVRPSYPKKGQVYAMVENGYITSLQQYTGSAWEAVDGRIWTGSRWIPAGSYNVITLQDMYDIVDATPDYEYIYTESGFWDWFQRAWKDLLARLDKIIDGQKGSGGGTALDPEDDTMLPSVEDNPETDTDEGWGAFDLLIVIKDGTWSIITGIVKTGFDGLVGLANGFTHITGFFNAYDANSPDNVLGITNYGGADIWD